MTQLRRGNQRPKSRKADTALVKDDDAALWPPVVLGQSDLVAANDGDADEDREVAAVLEQRVERNAGTIPGKARARKGRQTAFEGPGVTAASLLQQGDLWLGEMASQR